MRRPNAKGGRTMNLHTRGGVQGKKKEGKQIRCGKPKAAWEEGERRGNCQKTVVHLDGEKKPTLK